MKPKVIRIPDDRTGCALLAVAGLLAVGLSIAAGRAVFSPEGMPGRGWVILGCAALLILGMCLVAANSLSRRVLAYEDKFVIRGLFGKEVVRWDDVVSVDERTPLSRNVPLPSAGGSLTAALVVGLYLPDVSFHLRDGSRCFILGEPGFHWDSFLAYLRAEAARRKIPWSRKEKGPPAEPEV